jgi:hypothetical protein
MTERKHTPGPWVVMEDETGEIAIVQDAGYEGGLIVTYAFPVGNATEANACLIAAAPELLAALRNMLADTHAWQIGRDTRDRARAAIAKATEG